MEEKRDDHLLPFFKLLKRSNYDKIFIVLYISHINNLIRYPSLYTNLRSAFVLTMCRNSYYTFIYISNNKIILRLYNKVKFFKRPISSTNINFDRSTYLLNHS